MSLSRHAARKDTGSTAIVDALRAVGVKVWVLSGDGIPDLLTLYRGHWLPMELKNPGGEPTLDKRNGRTYRTAPGKLTASQERFVASARQGGAAVPVASSPAEAVAFVLAATRTVATSGGMGGFVSTAALERKVEALAEMVRSNAAASRGKPAASGPTAGPEATGNHKPCPRCINVPPTPEG